MSYGIYDYDLWNYQHTWINLECCKWAAYLHNHKEFAALCQQVPDERFTRFIIRKDYDDGIIEPAWFKPNCQCGGRAFSSSYLPLPEDVENTAPELTIYEPYFPAADKPQFQMYHTRLYNGYNFLTPDDIFANIFVHGTARTMVLHDYSLVEPQYIKILEQISNPPKQFAIANKFPIDFTDSQLFLKWCRLPLAKGRTFFRFHGFIDDEILYEIVEYTKQNINGHGLNYFEYDLSNIDWSYEENLSYLPRIFAQSLYLWKSHMKVLLNFGTDFYNSEIGFFFQCMEDMVSYQPPAGQRETFFQWCLSKTYKNNINVSTSDNKAKVTITFIKNFYFYISQINMVFQY